MSGNIIGRGTICRKNWRVALSEKAVQFESTHLEMTTGYRIAWYLWAADIWFGRFPLIKSLVVVNVVAMILGLLI